MVGSTSAFSNKLAQAGVRLTSSDMGQLWAVYGEGLDDQIAALTLSYWQGQPLVPLGAATVSEAPPPPAGAKPRWEECSSGAQS